MSLPSTCRPIVQLTPLYSPLLGAAFANCVNLYLHQPFFISFRKGSLCRRSSAGRILLPPLSQGPHVSETGCVPRVSMRYPWHRVCVRMYIYGECAVGRIPRATHPLYLVHHNILGRSHRSGATILGECIDLIASLPLTLFLACPSIHSHHSNNWPHRTSLPHPPIHRLVRVHHKKLACAHRV